MHNTVIILTVMSRYWNYFTFFMWFVTFSNVNAWTIFFISIHNYLLRCSAPLMLIMYHGTIIMSSTFYTFFVFFLQLFVDFILYLLYDFSHGKNKKDNRHLNRASSNTLAV